MTQTTFTFDLNNIGTNKKRKKAFSKSLDEIDEIYNQNLLAKFKSPFTMHFLCFLLLVFSFFFVFLFLCAKFTRGKDAILGTNLSFGCYFAAINFTLLFTVLSVTIITLVFLRKIGIQSKLQKLVLVTDHYYKIYLVLATAFLFYSFIMSYFYTFFLKTVNNKIMDTVAGNTTSVSNSLPIDTKVGQEPTGTNFKKQIIDSLQFLLPTSIIMYFILLQRIFLRYINIQIHCKYYKNRIEEYERRTRLILLLDKDKILIENTDPKFAIKQIYEKINKENCSGLSFADFELKYGPEHAFEIFNLFDDKTQTDLITEAEFGRCFIELYEEKVALNKCISGNKNILRKIKILTICFVYPLAFFTASLSVGKFAVFSTILKGFLGLVLPASFIFGNVLSEMFKSLIYLFCVRPFDAGDFIMFDDKIYEVYEIGLLYSTLSLDNLSSDISNEKLRGLMVYNLRNVKYMKHKIKIICYNQFSGESFRETKNKLKSFLDSNKKDYVSDYLMIENFEFSGAKEYSFCITLKVNFATCELREFTKRKDKLKFFLYDLLQESKIISK